MNGPVFRIWLRTSCTRINGNPANSILDDDGRLTPSAVRTGTNKTASWGVAGL